jgi:hypothetical protein
MSAFGIHVALDELSLTLVIECEIKCTDELALHIAMGAEIKRTLLIWRIDS